MASSDIVELHRCGSLYKSFIKILSVASYSVCLLRRNNEMRRFGVFDSCEGLIFIVFCVSTISHALNNTQ